MRIRREGVSVSGSQFLRVGLLAMPLALAASLAMLFVH
jgi:Na+/H+ antiporter NhaD/arsenite permease-like protein